MIQFAEGEYDVLIATTIIENGLDIPNANTIIINRAENFGLAQLYQLRGRVGRSAQRGHCYLLHDKHVPLSFDARRRLSAIMESSEELGAGFRIAMRDLEIRGAGELLGSRQSGNIDSVGFDLYTRLLAQAITIRRSQDAANTIRAVNDLTNELLTQNADNLRTAAGVIASAGFTLMGEAVYLRRPMLAIPVVGQLEQILNARYLEREGYGLCAETLTDARLREFIERLPAFEQKLAGYRQDGNRDLLEALENGVSQAEERGGRFPQVSGLRFVWDPGKPAGDRVVEAEVAGKPLDPDATYKVATNDYMLGGGDGYASLGRGRVLIDAAGGTLMANTVINYVTALGGTVAPGVEGRITMAQ